MAIASNRRDPIELPRPRTAWVRSLVDRPLRVVEHLFGLDEIERMTREVENGDASIPYMQRVLVATRTTPRADSAEIARVPAKGPVLVVCNHPLGGADSIALLALMQERRSDTRILANSMLACFPFARESMILVDPFGGRDAVRRNAAAIRHAIEWLRDGHLLIAFPAGEVSAVHWGKWSPCDPPWSTIPARMALAAGASIVPAWCEGTNRPIFHAAGLVHPRLRTALLPNEFLARRGTSVDFRFGRPVKASEVAGLDAEAVTRLVRGRSELLRKSAATERPPAEAAHAPVESMATTAEELAAEFAALPVEDVLFSEGAYAVYATKAALIPKGMREIGRLREIAFRAVGEGSGKSCDTDRFDETYTQIIVWNKESREIVGGYRAGPVSEVTRDVGVAGLYTSTLFDFSPRIVSELPNAVELGRSFVRLEYQRQPLPLSLLWKGIGIFMFTRGYQQMFGPVSISKEYNSMSKELIMEFLERHRLAKPFAPLVRPKHPPTRLPIEAWSDVERNVATSDLTNVDRLVDEIERGQRAIPVLLRQYLRLNARLLAFNVDPDFGDVVDALMIVDLLQIDERIVRHYVGDEGPALLRTRFQAAASAR